MKFKEIIKKYKWLLLVILLLIIGIVGAIVLNNNKKENKIEPIAKELPLKIDTIPLSFNIVTNEIGPVLEASYTNNSKETISRLTLDVILKDTGETIQLTSNESIQPGQTAILQGGKAPTSGKIEDVEVLKYKISVSSGIYMEYDTKLKQYNWS